MNVILDLISVIGLNMGVAGVAVATIGSQAISAAICILVMFRKYPDLMPKRHTLRRICPLALKYSAWVRKWLCKACFFPSA